MRERMPTASQSGSRSDSHDNALAETTSGPYKTEVTHRRGPWRSFGLVECATLGRVDWFNERRLLAPMGYIPPARAEERYHPFMAAHLKQNSLWQIRGSSGLDRQPKLSDY